MASLLCLIFLILSIAFYTMVERKVLGLMMMRLGPNKPSFLGLLVPLMDALKLLTKNKINLKFGVNFYMNIGPMMSFMLMLLLWGIMPLSSKESCIWSLLWFMCLSGLGVYSVFLSGWGSDSKFSFMGALRAVAQTISYEVSLGILLICLVVNISSFDLDDFKKFPSLLYWSSFLFIIWLISCLMETNRAPFDLSEGESELVSGFNTEYGSLKFALLFLGEYGIMIFLSLLTSIMFYYMGMMVLFPMIAIFFIWARSAYPRMRYDSMMKFMWKIILPVVLSFLTILI
uniref:NADH-ubiquinone oxidoreductase chain 1 n=1 Tax=Tubulipora flabellaris TaxID=365325 RepID=F6GPJ5_9BILA|nr:NADH dehydrogenase subunit 1 [Tubulipora flabellaris]ACB12466.1 NADH dehydrogenase subunit 1 [Tubulipora flabellaris]